MIEEIKKEALEKDVPIIKDGGLIFLLNFIEKNHLTKVLELGTAVAYSAINMAKINKDIHIDTIEKNEDMYKQALINIKKENLSNQIQVYFMPIEEYKTDKKYDFIFVDAAKAQYGKYLEQFIDNLDENGYILFDNMVFHNMIYNIDGIKSKNTRSLVKKIVNFREKMSKDSRFDIIFYDNIGDGLLLLSRRK